VTNWQEFRDPLRHQRSFRRTDVSWFGSQIVPVHGSCAAHGPLFLRSATLRPTPMVRDHFKILHECHLRASRWRGQDHVAIPSLATFSDPDRGPQCRPPPLQMELAKLVTKPGIPVGNSSAPLHAGPCLAVNANDKLDYFGSVVNLAARLLEKCQGDDLVLAEWTFSPGPETQDFLRQIKQSAVADREQFTRLPRTHPRLAHSAARSPAPTDQKMRSCLPPGFSYAVAGNF